MGSSYVHNHVLCARLLVLLMVGLLWMLPQMTYSCVAAQAPVDEFGSRPAPPAEEEEVRHYNVLVCPDTTERTLRPETSATPGPGDDEQAHLPVHGDVPHLPPW